MRIFTLTCHDVYNYGASLQAFALQQYLIKEGHNVKIIDYKPDYLSFKYRLSWYINDESRYYDKCKTNNFYHILYAFRRYFSDLKTIGRKRSFQKFNKNFFYLTSTFNSYTQLCKNSPEGDVYIVGSDQVWNNHPLNNGWDPSFFLNFGGSEVKRISYAASFGSTVECPWIMSKWLKCLDAISVRESKSLSLLHSHDIGAQVVCDPVFLLTKDDWGKYFELNTSSEGYVLVYNLSGNKTLLYDAKRIAQELNCKIHYIAVTNTEKGVINLKNVDPREFVQEIANAAFILSDSFHATAFSLIFQKQFFSYTFKNEQASDRITSLLYKLGLIHRFNPEFKCTANPINYDDITSNVLQDYITQSKMWLNKHLND